jgi:hypothetical protein
MAMDLASSRPVKAMRQSPEAGLHVPGDDPRGIGPAYGEADHLTLSGHGEEGARHGMVRSTAAADT